MILPIEFYYAAISGIIGILWTNKLNFDSGGRLHFKGKFVGIPLGFFVWFTFFMITYFIISEITKPLIDLIISLTGTGFLFYIKDLILILIAFGIFYFIYKIKIKCKTKEGIRPQEALDDSIKAVKKIPKKINKINKKKN